MENLFLERFRSLQLCQNYCLNSFTVDADSGTAYYVSDNEIFSLNLSDFSTSKLGDFGANVEDSRLVHSAFLLEDRLYFLLFSNGRIVIYDVFAGNVFEHSLQLPEGSTEIDAASFSHDQESLVMCASNNVVLLYNRALSLQSTYDLARADYGESEFVNINWGSKETQFHGTGMRDHRTVKHEFYPLSADDDRRATVEWRDDDTLFVVNHVSVQTGVRQLRIFNRLGSLQHTSENIPGLEKAISWRATSFGGLIACVVRTPNKHQIAFVEKNGLRHGEFDLQRRSQDGHFVVERIEWSPDSEVLAVQGRTYSSSSCEDVLRREIRLFTSSNYHWYEKQCFYCPLSGERLDTVWAPFSACQTAGSVWTLHSVTDRGNYSFRQLGARIGCTTDKQVLVIDGNVLAVSTFECATVPPPMCNYAIECADGPIGHVICSSSGLLGLVTQSDVLLLFAQRRIDSPEALNVSDAVAYKLHNLPAAAHDLLFPVLKHRVRIDGLSSVRLPVLLENSERTCFVALIDDAIVAFDLEELTRTSELTLKRFKSVPTDGFDTQRINSWIPIPKQNSLLTFTSPHEPLLCYDLERATFEAFKRNIQYPSNVQWMDVVCDESSGEVNVFTLTRNNCLFVNNLQLVPNSFVNSATLHLPSDGSGYLLFTSNDTFSCYPLSELGSASVCPQELIKRHPPRAVERGARIVATSLSEAKVVLQMPRGNLEQFHPRTLILDQVKAALGKKDYRSAFESLRRNRIDLNVLCDYDFDDWKQNCGQFVEQIPPDWLCLFLSDLSDRPNPYFNEANKSERISAKEEQDGDGVSSEVTPRPGKINDVCQTLCDEMNRVVAGSEAAQRKLLNPILLSHIRRQPPRIDCALRLVAALRNPTDRSKALDFVLYSVKPDRLFDEALGTYDFDILLMVTEKCSRDPKEAMALKAQFEAIEDVSYRRAKIDLHLRRWVSALKHLGECGQEKYDELLELVVSRNLYQEAIRLFGMDRSLENSDRHSAIWNAYGEYLFKKRYHRDAALAFQRAKNWSQAVKSFLMDGNEVQRALDCARHLPETRKQYCSIATQLALNGQHSSSGWVYELYLADDRSAFEQYLAGHKWSDALRCVRKLNPNEEENTSEMEQLTGALKEAFESTKLSIQSLRNQLTEHVERLAELKSAKLAAKSAIPEADLDEIDVYSDTSSIAESVTSAGSVGSRASLRTNRSAASIRRKQKKTEAKRYQLKRGSPNEDLQIVYAVKELFANSPRLLEGVDDLIVALFEHFLTSESAILEREQHALFRQLHCAVDAIWKDDFFVRRLEEDELLCNVPTLPNGAQHRESSQNLTVRSPSGTPSTGGTDGSQSEKWTVLFNSFSV